MTVGELEEHLSTSEYYEWNEFFKLEKEASDKAKKDAETKSKTQRRRRR